jgi:hypothetical protein
MMPEAACILISKASDFYLNELVSKLIYHLKRAPQKLRLNPDCELNNLWEEICVQVQTDQWSGWDLLEKYVESQCYLILEQQPDFIQQILSFEFLENDEISICVDEINEKLKTALFQVAMNYANRKIEKYLNF